MAHIDGQIDDIQKTLIQLRSIRKLHEEIKALEKSDNVDDLDFFADTLDESFRKNIEITQYFLNKCTNETLIAKYKKSIEEMNQIRKELEYYKNK